MNGKAKIGIIGGSGLYSMPDFELQEEVVVETPFGAPSERVTTAFCPVIRVRISTAVSMNFLFSFALPTPQETVIFCSAGMAFTGLGVGNRQGVVTQLAGCILAVSGMIYAFYIKPIIKRRRAIVGSPATARARMEQLAAEYGADEVMVVTITYDHAARRRSYELLAAAFGLQG